MKFVVEIRCDNAAFGETKAEAAEEVHKCLARVRARMNAGDMSGKVFDSNGNSVGRFEFQ